MNSAKLLTLSIAEAHFALHSLNRNILVMTAKFYYSTDFYGMNSRELSHTCMHLLCLAGEGSFVFNEHCYHIVKNDMVVIPMPDRVSNLAGHADLQVEWFAADYKFLQNLLPSVWASVNSRWAWASKMSYIIVRQRLPISSR